MAMTKRILLTGASGYLGQHLLYYWMQHAPLEDYDYKITALYHRSEKFAQAVQTFSCRSGVTVDVKPCDLTSWDDLLESTIKVDDFDICIHAAALSSPQACQADPNMAHAMNIPTKFFDRMVKIPMIALSTDQVYDGTKDTLQSGYYLEDEDEPRPLNVYAITKLEMEEALRTTTKATPTATTTQKGEKQRVAPTIILRSSIMLGPQPPLCPAHKTFLHFCKSRNHEPTTLFVNEYRTVVSVKHVCRVIDWWMVHLTQPQFQTTTNVSPQYQIYNLGGSIRVNRYDMAEAVFSHFGYDTQCLEPVLQTSPTSPLDISMDSRKLQNVTSIVHNPETLSGLVQDTF